MAKNSAPKSNEERERRRLEVKDFMENVGPFSVPVKVLAEKFDVAPTIIYSDIKYWLKRLDFKHLDLEGRKLIMMLRNNLAIAEQLAAKGKPQDRIRAIQVMNQSAEQFTKILENYGFKEKIADKVEHTGIKFVVEREVVEPRDMSKSEVNDEVDSASCD